jgi:hypothetical protein
MSTTPTHHGGRCLLNLQSRQASSLAAEGGRKQKRQVGSCSTTLTLYFWLFSTFIEKDALVIVPVNQFNGVSAL